MDEKQIKRLLSSLKQYDDIIIGFEKYQSKEFSVGSITRIDGEYYRIKLVGDESIYILKYDKNKYIVREKNTREKRSIQSIQFDYKSN